MYILVERKNQDERIFFIRHIGYINIIVLAYLNIHTWTTNVYIYIFEMKEINGTTICVNETCQLLYMNQCNK